MSPEQIRQTGAGLVAVQSQNVLTFSYPSDQTCEFARCAKQLARSDPETTTVRLSYATLFALTAAFAAALATMHVLLTGDGFDCQALRMVASKGAKFE